jgi:uncharacterized protein (DUF2235 family)
MLPKGDRTKQMVYYQAGIGTYTTPQIATPFWSKISKVDHYVLSPHPHLLFVQQFVDEAVAWNLDAHVMGSSLLLTPILR